MRGLTFLSVAVLATSLSCVPGCEEVFPCPPPLDGRGASDPVTEDEKARRAFDLFQCGLSHIEDKDGFGDALKVFEALIRIAPEEPAGYINAAVAKIRLSRPEAEPEALARKALEIDPENAYAWGILGRLAFNRRDSVAAVEALEKAIRLQPNEPRFRYLLVETFSLKMRASTEEMRRKAKELKALSTLVPGNIRVRLELAEALFAIDDIPGSQREFVVLKELWGVLGPQERQQFDRAVAAPAELKEAEKALAKAKAEGADARTIRKLESGAKRAKGVVRAGILMLHNLLKQGPTYPMHVREVKQTTGFEGVHVLTLSEKLMAKLTPAVPPEPIDVKLVAGEPIRASATAFCLIDADGDEDDDLYVAGEGGGLIRNDGGAFKETFAGVELPAKGVESCIAFDVEDDTDLDLILSDEEKIGAYLNALWVEKVKGKVAFARKTPDGIGKAAKGRLVIRPIDYDHDGDLDLFLGPVSGPNRLLLNRLEAIGDDKAVGSRIVGDGKGTREAIAADIDDDGDIDVLLLDGEGKITIYDNRREGLFEPTPVDAEGGPFEAAEIVDLDNDGLFDVAACGKEIRLLRNAGDAKMEAGGTVPLPDGFAPTRIRAIDYDNDGFREIAVAGAGGLLLFRNVGPGSMVKAPVEAPDLGPLTDIAVTDTDRDGDLDLVVLGDRGLRVVRNDGGNANEWLNIRFRGRGETQFGRTNHFDLGGRAEMRAADLYQLQVVDGSVTHFGLGNRKRADIVRVVWTNGIPQSHFDIASRLDVTEVVALKGSCPFLYSWDGEGYAFVTDILGGSTLGMRIGEGRYAWSDNEDYIKVRGDQLRPKDGSYLLQVTEELWECLYYDDGELIVVDHPADVEIFPNEKFAPPPYPEHHIHAVGDLRPPAGAFDTDGGDVLDLLREVDGRYVVDFERDRYQGMVTPHSLTLDLGDLSEAKRVRLFLTGWIYWGDTSINISISQNSSAEMHPPSLSVPDGAGGWKVVLPLLGFPVGKTKTVVHDLTGLLADGDFRVRIETNQEIYWDRILLSTQVEESPHRATAISPSSAALDFRGFSRLYRDGRYSPHLYDHGQTTRENRWRHMVGYYTRHGDVGDLVQEWDDRYVILGSGDALTLRFDAAAAPDLPEGWRRDFLLHSVGYVKDGDLNTSRGQTVEPLPFRAMSGYPYGPDESYPDDGAHREYRKRYNTRWKDQEGFRAYVRSGEGLRTRSRGPGR